MTATNDSPRGLAVDDFDGDGVLDLALGHNNDNIVTILPGNGDGTFAAALDTAVGLYPVWLSATKLNGDAHADLVTANARSNDLSVLLGNGDGTFRAAVHYCSGDWPVAVAAADIDGDGDRDLLNSSYWSGTVSVIEALGDGRFLGAVNVPAGEAIDGVAAADLDGNGIADLAAIDAEFDAVAVLAGMGDGRFGEALLFATGSRPQAVAAGDLDLDGSTDLVTADSEGLTVLLGNGDGTFQEGISNYAEGSPGDVVIGDLNEDGLPDLVSVADHDENIELFLGLGEGYFKAGIDIYVGWQSEAAVILDLDGDDHLDLAVAHEGTSSRVSVLLGNGDGTFVPVAAYPAEEGAWDIAAGDLNHDGAPDLVTANYEVDTASVFFGTGDGTFGTAASLATVAYPGSVALADLDLDGHTDCLVVSTFAGSSLFLGNGDGRFQPPERLGIEAVAAGICFHDLNGDGADDLAVAGGYSGCISVLLNTTSFPAVLLAGPGPSPDNPPLVHLHPPAPGAPHLLEFAAYGASSFGVNVGSGDVNGTGSDVILTGAGPGAIYGPHVRGFGMDGTPVSGLNFLAYGTNKWGVNVAAGDIDGDGFDEVVTGAGPGAVFGPHVRAWDYDGTPSVTPVTGVSFFAYGTPKWGVNVAAGDIDGDGFDEIVTGAGPGSVYGPHVRGWNVDGGPAAAMPGVSFLAYGTNRMGVNVAVGDIDGDGIEELVTGPGPSGYFGAHVRGWDFDGAEVLPLAGCSFFAWPAEQLRFGAGVYAGTDLDGDGRSEIIIGQGPDQQATTSVKVFYYAGGSASELLSLESFPGLTHGATVAAGRH